MTGRRQQVLVLWLASSALDSRVLGWAFHDGTAGAGPQPAGDPPYGTVVDALTHGWRLLQISPLLPAAPGQERETSFLKHEFLLERMVEIDLAAVDLAAVDLAAVDLAAVDVVDGGAAGGGSTSERAATDAVAPAAITRLRH